MEPSQSPQTLAHYLNPLSSALIIVDIQNDFVHEQGKAALLGSDFEAAQQAVSNINRLIEAARQSEINIVYLRIEHSPVTDRPNYRARYQMRGLDPEDLLCATGSWGAEWYPNLLVPRPSDAVVTKYGYDGFQDTPLDSILHSRGVENLVMTGVVTNLCVQTTAEHGFGLGYHIVVVKDATAGDDDAAHQAALRNLGLYFGILADSNEIIQFWQN